MHRDGEPLEDLCQVALEALLVSLERFDVEPGCPFVGYASLTISGALKRHYRDYGWLMHLRGLDDSASDASLRSRTSGANRRAIATVQTTGGRGHFSPIRSNA